MEKMVTMPIEYLGEVSIYLGVGIQVVTALILGGLVGLDRERKLKSAGIKTNILICLGATLYTSIGLILASETSNTADPARMAAQIVSGIGFLGAGAIIQSKGNVIGMTTAATIWVVAAIGFTIGAGYPLTAFIFTVTVLSVLTLISPIYGLLEREKNYSYFHLEILSHGSISNTVLGILDSHEIVLEDIDEEFENRKKGAKITNVYIKAHQRQVERLTYEIKQILRVKDLAYYPISNSFIHSEHKSSDSEPTEINAKKKVN